MPCLGRLPTQFEAGAGGERVLVVHGDGVHRRVAVAKGKRPAPRSVHGAERRPRHDHDLVVDPELHAIVCGAARFRRRELGVERVGSRDRRRDEPGPADRILVVGERRIWVLARLGDRPAPREIVGAEAGSRKLRAEVDLIRISGPVRAR
eukprot:2526870-Rhodomonas_salina.2